MREAISALMSRRGPGPAARVAAEILASAIEADPSVLNDPAVRRIVLTLAAYLSPRSQIGDT